MFTESQVQLTWKYNGFRIQRKYKSYNKILKISGKLQQKYVKTPNDRLYKQFGRLSVIENS